MTQPIREPREPWRRNRKLVRGGFRDLAYLPRSRTGWNATLAAYAFSVRLKLDGRADLNRWAIMHGVAASGRCAELGNDALVLWHGTSAGRAEKIREVGLFHKRGLWTTTDPATAHNFTRNRSTRFDAGAAMIVVLLDRRELEPDVDYEPQGRDGSVLRFHRGLPPDVVEYILFDDRIEFVGVRKARLPKPWGVARFKKHEGRWVPRSKPPVRLDHERAYRTFDEWLDLSVRRVLDELSAACAIEVFSSLYATVDPTDALEHDRVLAKLEDLCAAPRQRKGLKQFRLRETTTS